MTTAYSPLLGLALPVTGELAGTWGTTVNDSITSLLDSAVAGTTTLSTDLDVTLTTTTGAANTAREAILLCSGARTGIKTITAPAQSKIYTVINATTGGYSVKVVGVGPTTGVTIVAGESAVIAWNGSDFIKISNTGGAASFTNVTVSGTTTLSGLTASTALALDASKNVVSVTNTGTGNNVLAVSPTITGTASIATLNLTNALGTAYGGTGLTSFTANGVVYASSTSALATGSALTFDGATLGVNGVSVGRGAGAVSTNTAVGASALAANTSGGFNTAVGNLAGTTITTATESTAVGYGALQFTNTGSYNTAVGLYALRLNTTGAYNVAIGDTALYSNTTASNNTAVGYQAGYSNTASAEGVFVGRMAGYSLNTTGDNYETFIGSQAGYSVTTGKQNTFVGFGSGYQVTTGAKNTILGAYQGNSGGLDIRTASNYIVLSDGDGNPLGYCNYSNGVQKKWVFGGVVGSSAEAVQAVGQNAAGNEYCYWAQAATSATAYAMRMFSTTANAVVGSITFTGSATAYNTSSDYRLKEDIAPMTGALATVAALKPVTYKWKFDGSDGQGFIAHELAEVVPDCVTGEKDAVDEDGNPKYQGIDVSFLVATLTAAIQELKAEFDAYKATHP